MNELYAKLQEGAAIERQKRAEEYSKRHAEEREKELAKQRKEQELMDRISIGVARSIKEKRVKEAEEAKEKAIQQVVDEFDRKGVKSDKTLSIDNAWLKAIGNLNQKKIKF